MATISVRGREAIIKHFKQNNNPYWKLYTQDSRTPFQSQLTEKKMPESQVFLEETLDTIDVNGIYVLETYSFNQGEEKQKFLRPNTSATFALTETALAGNTEEKGNKYSNSPVSLDKWLEAIRENTALSSQVATMKIQIEHLIEKNARLNELNVDLNAELDEYEEEDEEEEDDDDSQVTGGVPKNMEQALGQFLNNHGEKIIDLFSGLKGKKKIEDDEIPEETQEDNVQMSGIKENKVTTLAGVIDELAKHDPKIYQHLYKLVLIAEREPKIFNMFLDKLEKL